MAELQRLRSMGSLLDLPKVEKADLARHRQMQVQEDLWPALAHPAALDQEGLRLLVRILRRPSGKADPMAVPADLLLLTESQRPAAQGRGPRQSHLTEVLPPSPGLPLAGP